MKKRTFDFLMSIFGLLFLSPFLLIVAALIKLDSPGPIFFRQERVGYQGKIFHIHKFRTMVTNTERNGLQITVGTDVRVTRVGVWLRRYKFDELAQLLDVFLGHMSLVGPRPEVPRYVAMYPADIRNIVLSVRPGITEWSSIKFKNENEILAKALNPQEAYIKEVLPVKLGFYVAYVKDHSFAGDLRIIFATLFAMFR